MAAFCGEVSAYPVKLGLSSRATYSSCVVGLAEVAINTAGRGGVDHAAILLLEEVRPRSLGDLVRAPSVHAQDLVPLGVLHVGEGLVAEDASVVDHNIYPAEGVNGRLDHCVSVLSRRLDADGLTARLLNLVYDIVRVDEIIDHHRSTVLGESQAVSPADTSSAAGDECYTTGEVGLLTRLVWWQLL
jgi:hypothetical protein